MKIFEITEQVYPDTMTGDQMLKKLNDLHKWDGGELAVPYCLD